ncbi:MAG: sigma 54-interacting transcriptional regulator [Desulfobaccales bacterium]
MNQGCDEQGMYRYCREIINTMNDGLVVVAPDGTIMMVNRAFEEMIGYSRDELIGASCGFIHCDACEIARAEGKGHWCDLFDLGSATRKPCLLIRKDGSYVHVLKNASILRNAAGEVLGAVETLTDISEITKRDQKIQQLSRLLEDEDEFYGIVGKSAVMRRVFELTEKAAQSDAPIIIYGESGTGKELVALAIHELGKRRDGPFIQFNCAALNEALLESELFGHVKGAFTGAYSHRQGRFEAANRGDIFLDEIGDIPLSTQVKLLRVLETKQFERVGDVRSIRVDVRIISATNQDLESLVSRGKFREDLFFRINAIPIHLPPLRDRMEDVPLLVNHFIRRLREKSGKPITGLTPGAMRLIMDHPWPGNVRELKGVLEYAFVLAEKGLIHPEHLPPTVNVPASFQKIPEEGRGSAGTDEKTALVAALRQTGGNQSRAAVLLGVSRITVWHRMKKYGIDVKKLIAV